MPTDRKHRATDSRPAVRGAPENGSGIDDSLESRHDRDASPFDRAILGRALRSMMDELTAKVPRGDGEDGLPHPGYVRRGRPPVVTPQIAVRILELRATGLGFKRISRATGSSVTTVRRVLRKKAEEP